MALADFDAFRQAVASPALIVPTVRGGTGVTSVATDTAWSSNYIDTPSFPQAVGNTPSTSVALDYTGADGQASIPHPAAVSLVGLVGAQVAPSTTSPRMHLLIDRLVHQGGLSGNVNTLQTTNLPTAALTRYTSGEGVMAALTMFVAPSTTNTTITVLYTNQAGTSGRTGRVYFAQTPFVSTFWPIALEAGDLGVRSVQSIQLSANTGGIGNIGVVLYKPLAFVGGVEGWIEPQQIVGWNSPILSEAHLEALQWSPQSNSSINYPLILAFSEL